MLRVGFKLLKPVRAVKILCLSAYLRVLQNALLDVHTKNAKHNFRFNPLIKSIV